MKQVSFNSAKLDPSLVIEAEYRRLDDRSEAEKLSRAEVETLQLKFSNSTKDVFVKDFKQDQRNLSQRRAADAYGSDALRSRLNATREALLSSRDNLNANKSLAFRPGMNQLALA